MESALKRLFFYLPMLVAMVSPAWGSQGEETQLEPVVVSARKFKEDVHKVPFAVDVFSGSTLADAGVTNIHDLSRLSSNVYMKYSTFSNVAVIRGISSFDTSLYGPAGLYVDDVSQPMHFTHNLNLLDIERVEVLKGPQGTLYGRNSESGVIHVVTRKPGQEVRAQVSSDISWFDTPQGTEPGQAFQGHASGPVVSDTLFAGFAASQKSSNGFRTNLQGDTADEIDHGDLRGTLYWRPHPHWDVTWITDHSHHGDKTGFYHFFTGPSATGRFEINQDGENTTELTSTGQNLKVEYRAGRYTLRAITGFQAFDRAFSNDFDCTPVPLGTNRFDIDNHTLSQEIRLNSVRGDRPYGWTMGIYGFHEENTIDFDMIRKNPAMGATRRTRTDADGWALFGQGNCTFGNRLHVTAGLRADHLSQEGSQALTALSGNSSYSSEMDDTEFLPRASLSYDINPEIQIYATWAKGFLAGGYAYHLATDADTLVYQPEYTVNYEAGIKSLWFDKRLGLDLACFYIDMEDKQITEYLPGGTRQISNAAGAHSQGVEMDLKARPSRGFELTAGLGYTRAIIDDWHATEYRPGSTQPIPYDYGDKELPNVPVLTYHLGAQYMAMNGWFARIDYLGTGEFYFDAKNTMEESAYGLVNLRLGYMGEHFDLTFWAKNLCDEAYETIKIDWNGQELGMDGSPREFGLKITWRI
jgi:iron complex outermembrane receptor protein